MDRPIAGDPSDEGSFEGRCDVMDRKWAVAVVVGVLAASLMCTAAYAGGFVWEYIPETGSEAPDSYGEDNGVSQSGSCGVSLGGVGGNVWETFHQSGNGSSGDFSGNRTLTDGHVWYTSQWVWRGDDPDDGKTSAWVDILSYNLAFIATAEAEASGLGSYTTATVGTGTATVSSSGYSITGTIYGTTLSYEVTAGCDDFEDEYDGTNTIDLDPSGTPPGTMRIDDITDGTIALTVNGSADISGCYGKCGGDYGDTSASWSVYSLAGSALSASVERFDPSE